MVNISRELFHYLVVEQRKFSYQTILDEVATLNRRADAALAEARRSLKKHDTPIEVLNVASKHQGTFSGKKAVAAALHDGLPELSFKENHGFEPYYEMELADDLSVAISSRSGGQARKKSGNYDELDQTQDGFYDQLNSGLTNAGVLLLPADMPHQLAWYLQSLSGDLKHIRLTSFIESEQAETARQSLTGLDQKLLERYTKLLKILMTYHELREKCAVLTISETTRKLLIEKNLEDFHEQEQPLLKKYLSLTRKRRGKKPIRITVNFGVAHLALNQRLKKAGFSVRYAMGGPEALAWYEYGGHFRAYDVLAYDLARLSDQDLTHIAEVRLVAEAFQVRLTAAEKKRFETAAAKHRWERFAYLYSLHTTTVIAGLLQDHSPSQLCQLINTDRAFRSKIISQHIASLTDFVTANQQP